MNKTLLLMMLLFASSSYAQIPPIKLNPEASKQYLAIENQQKEIVRQANEALQQLEREKAALLIGANVPRAELAKVVCAADAGGTVTCAPRKSEPGAGSQGSGKEKAQASDAKSP